MPKHSFFKLLHLAHSGHYSINISNKDILNNTAHELVDSSNREFVDDDGILNSVDTELYFFEETGEYLEVTLYLTEFEKVESVWLYIPNK